MVEVFTFNTFKTISKIQMQCLAGVLRGNKKVLVGCQTKKLLLYAVSGFLSESFL